MFIWRTPKTEIEEIIEKDDITDFEKLSNKITFDFNQTIKKNNELYHYSRIPILLYCIEKNAIKCFKFALINGADPTEKSERILNNSWAKQYKPVWDAYGFAGAKGNIQIIRILENRSILPNNYLIEGCLQFHQKTIFEWIKKEQYQLLTKGIKKSIYFENYEAFDILIQNISNLNIQINKKKETLIQYIIEKNAIGILDILISKGANLNFKDIFYIILILWFLIKIIYKK